MKELCDVLSNFCNFVLNYFNKFLDSILESRGGNPKHEIVSLKLLSAIFYISPKESPQKIIQNACFTKKALFVIKICNFLMIFFFLVQLFKILRGSSMKKL